MSFIYLAEMHINARFKNEKKTDFRMSVPKFKCCTIAFFPILFRIAIIKESIKELNSYRGRNLAESLV